MVLVALVCSAVLAESVVDAEFVKWDAKTREVTVKRENGKETTYKLATNCEVRVDGEETKIGNVKAKWPVRLVYQTDQKEVIKFGAYDKIDRPPYRGRR